MSVDVKIVSVYFGKLPGWMQLWFDSCSWNPEFTWVFITDSDTEKYRIPINVRVINSELTEIKSIFQKHLGFNIALDNPYKLCDYRAIYWLILDHYGIKCDFWGWCDIDVVFGNLGKFLDASLFNKYDRILCLGHLSLVRYSYMNNRTYLLPSKTHNYRKVFTNSINVGFDEHYGLTEIWRMNELNQYDNENIVADIDPQFVPLVLTIPQNNLFNQAFYIANGRVVQVGLNLLGRFVSKEYAYMHFQKRKLATPAGIITNKPILISVDGFINCQAVPANRNELMQSSQSNDAFNLSDKGRFIRTTGRYFKRMLNNVIR